MRGLYFFCFVGLIVFIILTLYLRQRHRASFEYFQERRRHRLDLPLTNVDVDADCDVCGPSNRCFQSNKDCSSDADCIDFVTAHSEVAVTSNMQFLSITDKENEQFAQEDVDAPFPKTLFQGTINSIQHDNFYMA